MCSFVSPFQNIVQDVLDLPTLTSYISYARKHIHPRLSDEAAEELTRGYVEMRRRGNSPGSSKKVPTITSEKLPADLLVKYLCLVHGWSRNVVSFFKLKTFFVCGTCPPVGIARKAW